MHMTPVIITIRDIQNTQVKRYNIVAVALLGCSLNMFQISNCKRIKYTEMIMEKYKEIQKFEDRSDIQRISKYSVFFTFLYQYNFISFSYHDF